MIPTIDPVVLGTVLAGLLAPVITFLLRRFTNIEVKQMVALGVAVLLGCVSLAATGGFSEPTWGLSLLSVVGVSQTLYTLIVGPAQKASEAGRLGEARPQAQLITTVVEGVERQFLLQADGVLVPVVSASASVSVYGESPAPDAPTVVPQSASGAHSAAPAASGGAAYTLGE